MKSSARIYDTNKYGLPLLGVLFFSFYLLGYLFPDFWWTTHFLAFVPQSLAFPLLLIASICFFYPFIAQKPLIDEKQLQELSDRFGKISIIFFSLLAAYAMNSLPIYADYFGDAYKVSQHLDKEVTAIPALTKEALFSFSLSPWEGHTSTLAMITYIAYFLKLSYKEAFYLMDVFCGFFFVLSWLGFIRYYLSTAKARLIMGLAVLSAPFLLVFFGHIESYAPVFLSFSLWLMGILIYLQKKDHRILWVLIPGLLICLKFHPVALLFVPALVWAFIQHYAKDKVLGKKLSTWGGIGQWIILPIFIAGGILYFFVFQDHIDQRNLHTTALEFDRLFLPLFSPEAPLDTYNLLSFNHIFDYAGEILLWSPILLLLFVLLFLHKRDKIKLETASVQVLGMTFILFSSLFFMVNPLLSMQMDWDLMAIPAPVFIALALVLIKQVEESSLLNKLLLPSIALALLCVPNFYLHHQQEMLSARYESLGIRIYHSYYQWSSQVIERALPLGKYADRAEYEERKQKILSKLKPYAIPVRDFEYARMLIVEGKYYLRVEKDYDKALQYLLLSQEYYPPENNGNLYRMETHFLRKEFEQAFLYSRNLVKLKYPSEKKAIAIAVQCALEAGMKKEALDLTHTYLGKWQDNSNMYQVNRGLQAGIPLDSLKLLFAQGP